MLIFPYLSDGGCPYLMDPLRWNVPTKSIKNNTKWWKQQDNPNIYTNSQGKINKQPILAQIVYGNGKHVCIDNIKRKKLQPKPWSWSLNFTIISKSLLHTLYKLYKPHSQSHSLSSYTNNDSSSIKVLSLFSSLPLPMTGSLYK